LAFLIGMNATLGGFGVVWHIWWLAALGLLAIVILIIARTSDERSEHVIPTAKIAKIEAAGGGAP